MTYFVLGQQELSFLRDFNKTVIIINQLLIGQTTMFTLYKVDKTAAFFFFIYYEEG
ncbi:hypothetical protein [Calidifontibacillus erzurumensis]|uniref:Uncharacterized protein n=1 Tax=Calidifontibacillus erzurumensis TaxID=2741433 RepID=A0A8J8GBS3_9BACI|nr:hypothetical protein [Calidifontibacillus erzurumensis]NSL50624.1 hypothetical protein [Calidifontibacillus erzurumensis]